MTVKVMIKRNVVYLLDKDSKNLKSHRFLFIFFNNLIALYIKIIINYF